MKTLEDVRKALWDLYEYWDVNLYEKPSKPSDGCLIVYYPAYLVTPSPEEFCVPWKFTVMSYACGPAIGHTFEWGDTEQQLDSTHWLSPDPCATAIRQIKLWKKKLTKKKKAIK